MKKIYLSIFISCIMFFIVATGEHTYAEELRITMRGTSRVEVPVSYISLSFIISHIDNSALTAQELSNTKLSEIRTLLMSDYNIADKDIRIENEQIYPEYQYNRDEQDPAKRQVLLGYKTFNRIEIKIRDIERYIQIKLSMLESGIKTIEKSKFVQSTDTIYYNEGLVGAFNDAKQKATVLSTLNGYDIESATIEIDEVSDDYSPTPSILTAIRSENGNNDIGDAQRVRSMLVQLDVIFYLKK